jgi:bacterioferritin-associated ferredoxin
MYICLCNNLNSKKVNYALEKGISTTKKIYSFYNCKPKCGKCIGLMNCIVEKDGVKIKSI